MHVISAVVSYLLMHRGKKYFTAYCLFSTRIYVNRYPAVLLLPSVVAEQESCRFRLARLAEYHNLGRHPIKKAKGFVGYILNNIYILYLIYR